LDKLPVPLGPINDMLKAVSESLPSLDLLLPKSAKLHAEFSYEGHEAYEMSEDIAGDVTYEGLVSVGVRAGYSALYEATSKNRITLDVEFVSVNVIL
jgi:hypothetical protein